MSECKERWVEVWVAGKREPGRIGRRGERRESIGGKKKNSRRNKEKRNVKMRMERMKGEEWRWKSEGE